MNTRQFLRRILPVAGIIVLGLLGVALGWFRVTDSDHQERAAALRPLIGGPFHLVATDGTPVSDETYRGKIMLVYFGYTLCPDVCPTTLNTIAQAMAKLGPDAAKIQTLFITIDPQRDTPKVLATFVQAFGIPIVGLTGSPEQIAAAAKAYGVYYAPYKTKDAPDGYLMDHSANVYVMNPDGQFITTFNPETTADQMAERLALLIRTSASTATH